MGMHDRQYVQDVRSLNAFATRVYGWMSIGLACTAIIAFLLYQTGLYHALLPFWWVWAFGTFGVAMMMNFAAQKLSVAGMTTLFLTYASLEGLLFGTILPAFAMAYGGQVIWAAFLTGSVIFGAAMIYGIFTKNDLTTLGRILTFGLIGLMAVTAVYLVLSFFFPISSAMLVISYIGLVLFVGLTAFDAQTIRRMSMQVETQSAASYKLSLVMALKMYVNVIMIFWYLLQIFSSSNRR